MMVEYTTLNGKLFKKIKIQQLIMNELYSRYSYYRLCL